jgi:hypothetical protein
MKQGPRARTRARPTTSPHSRRTRSPHSLLKERSVLRGSSLRPLVPSCRGMGCGVPSGCGPSAAPSRESLAWAQAPIQRRSGRVRGHRVVGWPLGPARPSSVSPGRHRRHGDEVPCSGPRLALALPALHVAIGAAHRDLPKREAVRPRGGFDRLSRRPPNPEPEPPSKSRNSDLFFRRPRTEAVQWLRQDAFAHDRQRRWKALRGVGPARRNSYRARRPARPQARSRTPAVTRASRTLDRCCRRWLTPPTLVGRGRDFKRRS